MYNMYNMYIENVFNIHKIHEVYKYVYNISIYIRVLTKRLPILHMEWFDLAQGIGAAPTVETPPPR